MPAYFYNSDGYVVISAFQEDAEQLQQPAAVADSNAPPPSEPFQRNLLSFSRAYLRFSFISVAGLPEIVLADVALSPSLKAACGSWSHAALLEAPIMKCEKKSNRQTAHIAFQQVRCHELSHAACVLRHAHATTVLHATHNRFPATAVPHATHNPFHRLVQALLQDDAIAQATLLADTISKVRAPVGFHAFDACDAVY